MRKILSLFFLALLCSANAGESQDQILDGKIEDKNRNPIPFDSNQINAGKTNGTSSDANVYLRISAAKKSLLLVYHTSFIPTKIAAGSDFTRRFTPFFSCYRHEVSPERAENSNTYPVQGGLLFYRTKTIDFSTRYSGAVIAV